MIYMPQSLAPEKFWDNAFYDVGHISLVHTTGSVTHDSVNLAPWSHTTWNLHTHLVSHMTGALHHRVLLVKAHVLLHKVQQ